MEIASGDRPTGPHARPPRQAVRVVVGLLFVGLGAAPDGDGPAEQVASRSSAATATAAAGGNSVTDLRSGRAGSSPVVDLTLGDPVLSAKKAIADCQARFKSVNDYTCTFVKLERIDGHLTAKHVMHMKARSRPNSVYFKFQTPNKGREAIYVAGRHKGNVVAHDVGLFKVLAGTMLLDPKGEMAMDGCRHPITEAGIGAMVDTVARHWSTELTREESRIGFDTNLRIGTSPVTLIESVHPSRQPNFLFHKVKLYIDHVHGLPVRLEAYDWPRHPGAAPELVEEYTYVDLRLNVGLTDADFDPNNRAYSFGRF